MRRHTCEIVYIRRMRAESVLKVKRPKILFTPVLLQENLSSFLLLHKASTVIYVKKDYFFIKEVLTKNVDFLNKSTF